VGAPALIGEGEGGGEGYDDTWRGSKWL